MSKNKNSKIYSDLGFSNKFMFGNIMRDPTKAKPFLEEILGFPIHHIEYIEKEKEIETQPDSHGIRMDIYVNDGSTIYNCEMQTGNQDDLRKRSRYYQGQIDSDYLERGADYRSLKKTYVIFVCTFDLFGEDRYIYTFESRCEQNPELKLGDDSIKVFLNTKGSIGDVSNSFKELMHFIDTSEIKEYDSELVNNLKDALVNARKRTDWRGKYMFIEDYIKDEIWEAKHEVTEDSIEKYIRRSIKRGLSDNEIASDLAEDYSLSLEEANERIQAIRNMNSALCSAK